MANKFGEIELGGTLGGYEIINIPASKLPQDTASAVAAVNEKPMLGATYDPIWYWGRQTVNGINHLFIAEDIRATKNKDKSIVGLIINVPPGERAATGEGAHVAKIIESEPLPEKVDAAFRAVEKELTGVSYKPVIYFGKQPVRGENHYILCEAKVIYPGAEPYAAIFELNIFEDIPSLVAVMPIRATAGKTLLGYAFNW